MKTSIIQMLTCALVVLSPLAVACYYPDRAEIPNGMTATKDDMLAGQQSMKSYMAAMDAYLTCIVKEEIDEVSSMEGISEEERKGRIFALTAKHNSAVEEMETVAALFNEQVAVYRAQSQ